MLGKNAIEEALKPGNGLYCNPRPDDIQKQLASIDVRLGRFFWVPKKDIPTNKFDVVDPNNSGSYLPEPVEVFDPYESEPTDFYELVEVGENDIGIILEPGQTYLGHTEEFIGTSVPWLNAIIKTRSTLARYGIDIAKAAGFGDPGYCGRWTLELTNTQRVPILLKPGTRIGQIYFESVVGYCGDLYNRGYNQNEDNWSPNAMLPKKLTVDEKQLKLNL